VVELRSALSDDRAAVLAAMDALYEKAAELQLDELHHLFVDDPDLTFWGSEDVEEAVGPAELQAFARAAASAGTAFHFEWPERRVHIDGDVAWVNAVGTCVWTPAGEDEPRTVGYRLTAVFVRRNGRWLWHTHHGSEPNAG
jgi:ketosteroid isomerase-like protein